jgi:hypothetical protein
LVEAINVLDTKAQRKIEIRFSRLEQVERFQNRRTPIPLHPLARLRDVLTRFRGRGNERTRFERKIDEELAVFALDLRESLLRKLCQIHFVDDDDQLADPEQTQQIGVPPALFAHPFVCCDHENGCIGARRARDHVFQKFLVARRVDDDVVAARRPKRNLRRVDRDVLFLLLEQSIEQKRELKFHSFRRASLLHHVHLSVGQRIGVVQDATDERGLSVIDVAGENDAKRQLRVDTGYWILDTG